MINNILRRNVRLAGQLNFSFASGATFLKMVESFFDRAAVHTGIRSDRLNFYKKAENVVKCSIPLVRGTPSLSQTTAPLRPFPPIAASTRPTNCQPKEEPGTLKMWILRKLRPWPAS